jgi:hypothetical protein
MYFFLQLTLSGLSQGAIYGLIALSMTVVYRATTIVNFGHGDFVMAGAFVVYVLVIYLGLPYVPAAVLAVVISGCRNQPRLHRSHQGRPPHRLRHDEHILGLRSQGRRTDPLGTRGLSHASGLRY